MSHDLHLPTGSAPTAAAVVLHPHPAMGGDRHHPLVVAVCEGLAVAGVAALRVDLRDPDVDASALLVEAITADLLRDTGADRLVLVGYSWGSSVTARAAPSGLVARVLVAPPVSMIEFPPSEVATLVLVPAHDQYGSPEAVHLALDHHEHCTIEIVEGCDHFLAGAVARIAERSVAWIAAHH